MKSILQSLPLLLSITTTVSAAGGGGGANFDYSQYINSEPTTEGSILLLGDSWAAIAGDYAANICGLSNSRLVTNDAQNGSTASDWAEKETAVQSMEKGEYDYEYVWLSLGGNDFLDAKCDISISDQVAEDIVTVIGQIVDNSPNPDIKILYFGYSVPSVDVCGNGQTAQLFEEQGAIIFNAIKSSAYSDYVTTFDISEMFVKWGTNGLSDEYYYYDEIHLNQMGYLHLFSSYKVQRFFGCSAAQTIELKGISAVVEGKDNPAHLAGTVITTLVGLIMGIIALVMVVNFIKNKMRARQSENLLGAEEKAETGDYVVVDEEGKKKSNWSFGKGTNKVAPVTTKDNGATMA